MLNMPAYAMGQFDPNLPYSMDAGTGGSGSGTGVHQEHLFQPNFSYGIDNKTHSYGINLDDSKD